MHLRIEMQDQPTKKLPRQASSLATKYPQVLLALAVAPTCSHHGQKNIYLTLETWKQEPANECALELRKLRSSYLIFCTRTSLPEHAQVCESTRNQDVQRHALSQAGARASPVRIPRCREPLAMACLQVRLCQPPQSNETQKCMPGRYQYASRPCGGSNTDKLASEGILEQLIFPQGSSHFPTLSMTMYGWCIKPAAAIPK